MKSVLFVGSYIPQRLSDSVKYNSPAANNFQHNVMKHLNTDLDILTYVGYPIDNYKSLLESSIKCNIHLFTKNSESNIIKLYLNYYKRYLKLDKKHNNVLMYNINYISLFIPILCKITHKRSIHISADISEASDYKSIRKKILSRLYFIAIKLFDINIVLSHELYLKRSYSNKTEYFYGAINNNEYSKCKNTYPDKEIIVLYSGMLSEIQGVDILLKSIKLIKIDKISFIFTGKGKLEERIKMESENDNRIKYYGFLNRNEYLKILSKANILINPRNMKLPQNHNNFPSKILEYLATGKIIISTEFPGYKKFEKYMNFCESNPKSIVRTIKYVVNHYDKLYQKTYIKNRNFAKTIDWNKRIEILKRNIKL